MKMKLALPGLLLLTSTIGSAYAVTVDGPDLRPVLAKLRPHVAPEMLRFSVWHDAPLAVAKVYGRSPGCMDADAELIDMTARAAILANLDPAIAAATVATESSCNPLAISSRGAVGLTQVMPKIWSKQFDFGTVNLFNKRDNLETGFKIMADSITQFGLEAGIQRYNGTGVGCDTCDGGYALRILSLAHK